MRSSDGQLSVIGNDSTDSRPPLDYLHPSPVRGQLENYKEKTRVGWRFLQCTDTPDELKVLLPPRTAHIYSQLLSAETSELAKGKRASWEHILEIRRLKDRMIRKCGRLSRVWGGTKPGQGTLFRTVYAPADFRLKEMEKWIRDQGNPGRALTSSSKQVIDAGLMKRASVHTFRGSYCCDRCAAAAPAGTIPQATHRRRPSTNRGSWIEHPDFRPSPPKRRASTSSVHSISIQDGPNSYSQTISQTIYRASAAIQDTARNIHAVLEPYVEDSYGPSQTKSGIYEMPVVESPRVASPEPLPHPYREPSPRVATSDDDSTDDDTTESEGPLSPLVIDKDTGSDKDKDGSSVVGDLQPIPRPPLLRRRSSLKQSNGSSRASLNVAWAMDQEWQDQIKRYEDAAAEAEQAGA
ncbi:hypothetical protein HWV62_6557 [Athelia sp. TMB]|nr:hypothetical protein HWV62_6557 [Athelia sp. TMB]